MEDTTFEKILITVGTTRFDELIKWSFHERTIEQFKAWNSKNIKLQIGSSEIFNQGFQETADGSIKYELYHFKPNLKNDYEWADLIISHAGAGTVLDVLDIGKVLFVIPNESLMDNHQIELGQFIHKNRYGYSSKLQDSHSMMKSIRKSGLLKFPNRNINGFLAALENTMNFNPLDINQAKICN